MRIRSAKKIHRIILFVLCLLVLLLTAFFIAYRYVRVGGKIIKVNAKENQGFYSEYYLFIPDSMRTSGQTFLLVEPNNTGFVDDDHRTHVDAAYDIIRFGQANGIAKDLGVPLLVPCFDRPETNWEQYTHALDRDTILITDGPLERIDRQLLAMIEDAGKVLKDKNIALNEKILLNGFSASGSFVNRFTALYPEKVAGTAAGGINGMAILPVDTLNGRELIYPVGIADIQEIAGLNFQPAQFASVPQFYYMGENDENDALPFNDAYSDLERELVIGTLGEDMAVRWENCEKIYKSQGVDAEFHTFPGVGHETTAENNAEIVSFFMKVMERYQ